MQPNMYSGQLTDENIRAIFDGAGDFNTRTLQCGSHTLQAYAIDGLTAGNTISEYVFKPIMEQLTGGSMQEIYEKALNGVVVNSVAKPCETLDDAALMLVNGFCVVLFPGVGAIAFEVKTPEKRSISPPDLEHTSKGAKDAFVETIRSNTSLVRRHLRTPDLRFYETKVGKHSLTNVSVAWIQGVTDPKLVARMKRRLETMELDGMLSPASVQEAVTGSRATAFPLLQYTERTDSFCLGLLEGRVGLFVDGLPLGYLAPVDVGYLMSSVEDYGRDYISATAVRALRYLALFISLLLPALYVAMTEHHPYLLSDALSEIFRESKGDIPFSTVWEVLGLLVAFELLQESGVHLPQSIGQSVSIIGGIVVGTAGAEAGLISSITLIMVSVAGVCGFVLPNRDLATAVRVWRFVLTVLASLGGLTGMGIGLAVLLIRLACMKSLGVCYLACKEPGLLRKRIKDRRKDKRE